MVTYTLYALNEDGSNTDDCFITADSKRAAEYLNDNIHISEKRVCITYELTPSDTSLEWVETNRISRTRTEEFIQI